MRFSLSRLQPNLQLNRNVWYVLFTSAVVGFAVEGGIYSVLFNIYLLRLDYGTDFIGVVNSVGHFSYAIAALLASAAGQRWGVRRIMLVGIVLATLAGLLIPLAQSFHPTRQSHQHYNPPRGGEAHCPHTYTNPLREPTNPLREPTNAYI